MRLHLEIAEGSRGNALCIALRCAELEISAQIRRKWYNRYRNSKYALKALNVDAFGLDEMDNKI
jgi:Holliday junction resolvasome RuvABC ATP-dependent DNA helicase subunit